MVKRRLGEFLKLQGLLSALAFSFSRRWWPRPRDYVELAANGAVSARRRISACAILFDSARFDEVEEPLRQLESTVFADEANRLRILSRQIKRTGIVKRLEYYAPNHHAASAQAEDKEPDKGLSSGAFLLRGRDSKKIIFAFPAGGRNFWITTHFFDNELKNKGHHVVFLRDGSRRFCMAGVKGLGDSYQETVEALRQIAATLEATEIYCIGWSAGSYAAMRYGLDLGAAGILCFGPAFVGRWSLLRAYWRGSGFFGAEKARKVVQTFQTRRWQVLVNGVVRRVKRRRLPPVPLFVTAKDLRLFFRCAQQQSKVILVYGAAHKIDEENCRHLDGLPGVVLYPLAGCDRHNVLRETIDTGEFPSLLATLLSIEHAQ
jgi:hypothetical protein